MTGVFHITVGVAPHSTPAPDLSRDVEILKAAVLYGDKVKYCSPASSLITQLVVLGQHGKHAADREKVELFEQVFGSLLDARAGSLENAQQLRVGLHSLSVSFAGPSSRCRSRSRPPRGTKHFP